MEWKDVYEKSRKLVYDAVSVAKEKELREKTVKAGEKLIREAVTITKDAADAAVKMTREYAADHAGTSNDEYVKELEEKLKEKDREIRELKQRLARKSWKRR